MRKLLSSILMGFVATTSFAAIDFYSNVNVFEDIKYFKENKEEPRAFFIAYPFYEMAAKWTDVDGIEKIYDIPNYKLLNGDWKFLFLDHEKLFKKEYVLENFDDSKWDTLDVPNTWQAKGYDRIFYRNIPAEFQFHKDGRWQEGYQDQSKDNPSKAILNPTIPDDHREVGVYRRTFDMPKSWQNREVFIRFNGVRTGYKVFVNGNYVGYAEDSFTPSEFDITSKLKDGKNTVAVEVFKYSTGGFFEMQDMPHMSGIIRDVMLISRPKTYIRDYYAPVEISDDLKRAKIDFSAWINNRSDIAAKGLILKADIIDKDGKLLNSKSLFEKPISQISSGKEVKFSTSINVENFKLWSPDKPNLYALLITLIDANGSVLETIKADFGFRKFEVKGAGIFLNNKNVMFKGVNRHDWSPDKGKACAFNWQQLDVELMKEININALRTSHYPNDDMFYMLCSRYGLMVLDEANQEQHGFRNTGALDFDHFIPASVDRMRNMVFRDRNIPSVVIFSVGNESAGRIVKGHGDMAKVVRDFAPLHYVHSEAECGHKLNGEDAGFSDFASPMYGGVDRINHYLRSSKKKVPFFFCEYAHAMGNSIGNLKGKWDLMRANADCVHGGFIWDWVDQSLYLKDEETGERYLSDGRDWKTSPSAGNFCSNGIVRADRTYFAKFHEVKRIYQDIQIEQIDEENPKKVKITNEFFDTNLNEFDVIIDVSCNNVSLHRGLLSKINLPAGESLEMELNIPDFNKEGEYFCTLYYMNKFDFPYKYREMQTKFKLKDTTKFKELKIPSGKISVLQNKEFATIKAGKFTYEFDVKNAELKSLKRGKDVIINSPVKFDITSAFIDNERRGEVSREWRNRKLGSLKEFDTNLKIEKLKGSAVRVIASKILANDEGEGFANEFVYTILADGTMQVVASCHKINDTPEYLNLARVGLKMGLEPSIENIQYYGRGYFANYSDRKTAANVEIWGGKVKDFMEDYSFPQDTGNREDVRWLRLFNNKGLGIKLLMHENPLPVALLPYTQEELLAAKHPHLLKEPTQNELRVAWKVRGLGNNSCGPSTRNQFKPNFKGKVSWSFILSPIIIEEEYAKCFDSKKRFETKAFTNPKLESAVVFPKLLSYKAEEDEKNLPVEKVTPKPLGKLVSENAKVTYSSIDKKWSPKEDNLLTTGRGTFSFHTLKEDKPYLIVELDKIEEITSVEILNRSDAQGDRTTRLRMLVSEDGKNFKRIWGDDGYKAKWVINFKKPIKAKFVKLMLEKNEIFHLKRLRIFAN